MKWFSNFTLFMRSSVTSLKEKFVDPQRMVRQLIIDMEEELERVRTSVAGAIADEIQLRKRVDRAREETQQWLDRATTALRRGDEANSKQALEQKLLAEQRADGLDTEYRKQKEATAKLQRAVNDLSDKIRQARQKETLLLARLVRAESSKRIDRAMDAATNRSAFAQFTRLEDRVDRAEAMGEAYDRLEGRDPDAAELERQFEEKERKERLEREMSDLKQRLDETPEATNAGT
ncbi:MAG: PspA/IM30 family protein [Phycisphaeraceae bacterium]